MPPASPGYSQLPSPVAALQNPQWQSWPARCFSLWSSSSSSKQQQQPQPQLQPQLQQLQCCHPLGHPAAAPVSPPWGPWCLPVGPSQQHLLVDSPHHHHTLQATLSPQPHLQVKSCLQAGCPQQVSLAMGKRQLHMIPHCSPTLPMRQGTLAMPSLTCHPHQANGMQTSTILLHGQRTG